MYQKTVFISVIFMFIFTAFLFTANTLKLSGVRPPFFILKIVDGKAEADNNRVIYSENGNKIAEYVLVGVSGAESLCRCTEFSAEIDNNCYVKIRSNILPVERDRLRNNTFTAKVIKIKGITFNRYRNGIFVTVNPVPLSIVPELSIKGIGKFMEKIGTEYKKKCRVDLLSPNEISKYVNIEKSGILLAGKRGDPVLIFYSRSTRRENPVSNKILTRLKYEVFLPMKLIIL